LEWVETTGRTVAEALDAALDQLGVDEQEAEFQVLQEPQKGLFGRLRAEARVRARVRPARPRPKAERRDRRRRGGDRDGRSRRGGSGGGGRSSSVAAPSRGSGERGPSGNGAAKVDQPADRSRATGSSGQARRQQEVDQHSDATASGDASQNRRRRRRRGGSGGAKEQGETVTNETNEATTETSIKVADLEAQRDAVDEFLRGLLGAFGRPEATISVRTVDDDTVEADVHGEELGLLVGPKGQTLQAVHELVRSMVQRQFVGEAHARVRVDVAGYRQRRREALERFTKSVADQVIESQRPVVLDPMGASDRKTIHDVVNEIDGVKTVSEGEEPARRVIIQPV
jgi:spoIIIJ-associated protein